MTLIFAIPNPPSVNACYRNVSTAERGRARMLGKTLRGRRRTHKYNMWANVAGWAMKLENGKPRSWNKITGPVEVEIVSGNRRIDTDNVAKPILDLLTDMAVWDDDKQVERVTVSRNTVSQTLVIVREYRSLGEVA